MVREPRYELIALLVFTESYDKVPVSCAYITELRNQGRATMCPGQVLQLWTHRCDGMWFLALREAEVVVE